MTPRKPGRPPALSVDQVLEARRLRSLPPATRPRERDLAERYGVNRQTLRKALLGVTPYDFGQPVPPFSRARDRRYDEPGWSGAWNFTARPRREREQAEETLRQVLDRPVWSHRLRERRRS